MKSISHAELRELAGREESPAVSIYMPLHKGGQDNRQDSLRLKNLLRHARQQLMDMGHRKQRVEEMLSSAWELQQDGHYWSSHGADGLALFVAPGYFREYRMSHPFQELTVTAGGFHIKPMARMLLHDDRFYLLSVNKRAIKIYKGTSETLKPVSLPENAPASLEELVAGTEIEGGIQHHSVRSNGAGRAPMGIIHGQGEPKDTEKKLLEVYLRRVASFVEDFFKREHLPVVLASDPSYQSVFRNASRFPYLLEKGIPASIESLSEADLHRQAWSLVETWYEKRLHRALERFGAGLAAGRSSNELGIILTAAIEGRIESIFAAEDRHIWGKLTDGGEEPEIHEQRQPGDWDLCDWVVGQTLLRGGDAYVASQHKIPSKNGQAVIAALLRW
jgi:hypothetical protein